MSGQNANHPKLGYKLKSVPPGEAGPEPKIINIQNVNPRGAIVKGMAIGGAIGLGVGFGIGFGIGGLLGGAIGGIITVLGAIGGAIGGLLDWLSDLFD